jgi:hypothetical protein
MPGLSRAIVWLLVVTAIVVLTPRLAAAKDIEVRLVLPGETNAPDVRVISHGDSARSNQVIGSKPPQLKLTIYAAQEGDEKRQLVSPTVREGDGLRLAPASGSCVFAGVEWEEPSDLDERFFLPVEDRVRLCRNRPNEILLPLRQVTLTATVEPPADSSDDGEACIQYRQGVAWYEETLTLCAPVGMPIRVSLTRKAASETKVDLRATWRDVHHDSAPISFDLRAAAAGQDTLVRVPLGPRIWHVVTLRLASRATNGWEPAPAVHDPRPRKARSTVRELETLCVRFPGHTGDPPGGAAECRKAPKDGAHLYRCEDVQWIDTQDDQSILTARCPFASEPDGHTIVATGRTRDPIKCQVHEGICGFPEYFYDPERKVQLCFDHDTSTALESKAQVLVTVKRTDTGPFETTLPLDASPSKTDPECFELSDSKLANELGTEGPTARYSVGIYGPLTNHPYPTRPLMLVKNRRALDVFDTPLSAQELWLPRFSAGLRLLAFAGGAFLTGDLKGKVRHAEGGGTLVFDAKLIIRKRPTFSFGPMAGAEILRTSNWIERAPGIFEAQHQQRLRGLLGLRVEVHQKLDWLGGRMLGTEYHGAVAVESPNGLDAWPISKAHLRINGMFGTGISLDFSRRIPWLSLYVGGDVLVASRSELLRFEAEGDFSKHYLRSAKVRGFLGIVWRGNFSSSAPGRS